MAEKLPHLSLPESERLSEEKGGPGSDTKMLKETHRNFIRQRLKS